MKTKTAVLMFIAVCASAQDKKATSEPPVPVVLSEIKSQSTREYVYIRYSREYSATFVSKRGWYKVNLSCETFIGQRQCSGTLKQEDGKSVTFDPDSIADKIMHSELLPVLATFAKKAEAIDRDWWRGQHAVFIDEDGVTWTKGK